MPWFALALCLWGLFLGVADGPAAGAAVMAAGVALLVLRGVVDARRARRSRRALLAATAAARPAPRPTASAATPTTTVLRRPAFRMPDATDEALLQAFWNFGSVADAAALAGCEPLDAQRRLIELVLEPGAPVAMPAAPDRDLTDFEERAVLRGWNAGEPLASLSTAFGVSVFGLGGLLLAAGPIPVGARA